MRWKDLFIYTLREDPRDAEAASHKLLIRSGFIRKLSAGVYSYLPLGLRSLERISAVIREEMNRSGATELLMPALHPADLWKLTGRYEQLGEDKFSFKNRSDFEYVLGPTHEEIVTQLVADSIRSYKDLPVILYQIQGKFRDEARPRFGIVRSKEFLMKDAYSFDRDPAGLEKSYEKMRACYREIFKRTGIEVLEVSADPGVMGGNVSHEFMVRASFGEDRIASCPACGDIASLEIARFQIPPHPKEEPAPLESFETPDQTTIEDLTRAYGLRSGRLLKALIYVADSRAVMVLLRGDHEVNESKLRRALGARELALASAEVIEKVTGAPVGFSGPVGLTGVEILMDSSAAGGSNWVTGANAKDRHLRNVNAGRDFQSAREADVRTAAEGDACAKCGGKLKIETAMELGHIFKLGTRYSAPLKAQYLDEQGGKRDIVMGCYGIGVNRILAAAVEQFHDTKGIVWPKALAPFDIEILTLGGGEEITREAHALERLLEEAGFETLLDDRDERAGVKFNDADLIGIPLQIILSEKNLKEGKLEIKVRSTGASEKISGEAVLKRLREIFQSLP
jgi:prolyl-tRNA synthetase